MPKASVIDIPKSTLDSAVWEIESKPVKIRAEVREYVVESLKSFISSIGIEGIEDWMKDLYADGSLLTFQWQDDSDFDTYIKADFSDFKLHNNFPLIQGMTNEEISGLLTRIFRNHLDGKLIPGTNHPITYYVVSDVGITQSSDAVYDLLNDKWVRNPPAIPFEYDPASQFSDVWKSVIKYSKDLDVSLGEARRDIIDYEKLKSALSYSGSDSKKVEFIKSQIGSKLLQINADIENLIKEFEEIHDQRKEEFGKEDVESSEKLWNWSKSWAPGNLQYKFLERYKYIAILHAIKKIYNASGDEITEEDIPRLREVLKQGSVEECKANITEYYFKLSRAYYKRCRETGKTARLHTVRKAGLISEWDLGLIETSIGIITPIMFLSGNPVLMAVTMILKKMVDKIRSKMMETKKRELQSEELGISSLQELE